MPPAAGLSRMLGAVAGLLIWAAHFAVVYMANAVACERGLARVRLIGLPLIPLLVVAVTALALFGVAVIAWRAWGQLGGGTARVGDSDDPGFLSWFTLATAALAGLAIIWAGLPWLLVRACA